MKHYTSFEAIESDLKQYKLEQKIALEELKLTKNEVADNLKPLNWLPSIGKIVAKYGVFYFLKRIFSSK